MAREYRGLDSSLITSLSGGAAPVATGLHSSVQTGSTRCHVASAIEARLDRSGSAISAHELGASKNVPAHRAIQVSASRIGSQLEPRIERIQPEVVAVGCSARRAGTAVADVPKIITSLSRT